MARGPKITATFALGFILVGIEWFLATWFCYIIIHRHRQADKTKPDSFGTRKFLIYLLLAFSLAATIVLIIAFCFAATQQGLQFTAGKWPAGTTLIALSITLSLCFIYVFFLERKIRKGTTEQGYDVATMTQVAAPSR